MELCKITNSQPAKIMHNLIIHSNLTSPHIHKHLGTKDTCSALQPVPVTLTSDSLRKFVIQLDHLHICYGHPDSHFVSMLNAKKGKIISQSGSLAAYVDHCAPVSLHGKSYLTTVRTLLSHSQKCNSRKQYRGILRSIYSRWSKKSFLAGGDTSSRSNDCYLNTPEKKAKMHSLRARARTAEKEARKLRDKLKQVLDQQSEPVDSNLNADLLAIMHENTKDFFKKYPEGSFAQLLGRAISGSISERWLTNVLASLHD